MLIARDGPESPFLVHWRVPLGGGGARRELPLDRGVWLPVRVSLTARATLVAGGGGGGGGGQRAAIVVELTLT